MVVKSVSRDTLLPFQSRLFQNKDKALLCEISQFQIQSWGLGKKPFHFRAAVGQDAIGRKMEDHFGNLGTFFPDIQMSSDKFLMTPRKQGNMLEFSIAATSIMDEHGSTPSGFINLSMGLAQSDLSSGPWLLRINIESIFCAPETGDDPVVYMLCAAVADVIYDELRSIHLQAKAQKIPADVHVQVSHQRSPALNKPCLVIARELEFIRHLFISADDQKKGSKGIVISSTSLIAE
jgi:hypothetical protein